MSLRHSALSLVGCGAAANRRPALRSPSASRAAAAMRDMCHRGGVAEHVCERSGDQLSSADQLFGRSSQLARCGRRRASSGGAVRDTIP